MVAGSGGNAGPTGPTPNAARISRTRFLAFGDSFTAGEVTNPDRGTPARITKLIVVPTASYPTRPAKPAADHLHVAGHDDRRHQRRRAERAHPRRQQRFPGAFDATRPEVVLLMEGVNGLPLVGPDISTGVMRIMVQHAKNGGARVFVGSMIPQVRDGRAATRRRASCWPTTTRCR